MYRALCVWVLFFFGFQNVGMVFSCSNGVVEIKNGTEISQIKVEIADTRKKRQQGLMFREKLPYGTGMLFIFDEPTHAKFWMKNTSLSLDIAFINSFGLVIKVVSGTVPYSLETIDGGKKVQYVLEVLAGTARNFNLSAGSILRSNRMGSQALWKC